MIKKHKFNNLREKIGRNQLKIVRVFAKIVGMNWFEIIKLFCYAAYAIVFHQMSLKFIAVTSYNIAVKFPAIILI